MGINWRYTIPRPVQHTGFPVQERVFRCKCDKIVRTLCKNKVRCDTCQKEFERIARFNKRGR